MTVAKRNLCFLVILSWMDIFDESANSFDESRFDDWTPLARKNLIVGEIYEMLQ